MSKLGSGLKIPKGIILKSLRVFTIISINLSIFVGSFEKGLLFSINIIAWI